MPVEVAVLGVPTSAGAHHAGQDLAPAALRRYGFVDNLRTAGFDVGDVDGEVFRADTVDATARNIDAVIRVALAVADAVERETRADRLPIVLGGDCTITLGVMAGLQRVRDDVRLAYFDGDADLNSPERTRSGVLDATGVAHLLGIADTPLAAIGRIVPMLAEHQLVLLGYDATDPDSFDRDALAVRPSLTHFDDATLRADPIGVARTAVALSAVTMLRSRFISMSMPWTPAIFRWRTSRTTALGCRSPWPGRCSRPCSPLLVRAR